MHDNKWLLQPIVSFAHKRGILACEKEAEKIVSEIGYKGPVVNVGGGDGRRWPLSLNIDRCNTPIDFNTSELPICSGSSHVVICEQVIEHIHNTTWFISELYRIVSSGGHLILSTENLASIPNILALILQRAPFSTQHVCGMFAGGWRDGECSNGMEPTNTNDPAFSGTKGHVRVMTTRQLLVLLKKHGFRILQKRGFSLNHYILIHATK